MGTELESTPNRKEEKKKKTKDKQATSNDADVDVNVEDKKSKKKSKQKSSDDVMEDVEASEHKERKRKREHRDVDAENDDVQGTVEVDVDEPSEKKKKRKRNYVSARTGVEDAEEEKIDPKAKKPKKIGKRNDEEKYDANGIISQDTLAVKKKEKETEKNDKKKHKKDRKGKKATSFQQADPSEDTELSDKARGALSYAYARLSSPDSWKFNKAHQNWIVKHVFSIDAISEKYMPTVAAYLSGCQGGVRENLIQTCNKRLDLNIEPSDSKSDAPTSGPLKEDEISGAVPEVNVSGQGSVEPSPEVQEAIKSRARAILEALRSNPSSL